MNGLYKQKLWWLIGIASLCRLVLAGSLELGNDEVYYWTYAEKLQANYFDHPPMVAIWILLGTLHHALDSWELFIRLGSVLSAAACTGIIYIIGKRLHSEKAGFITACLYTASLYASIIAGVFIMPDSPQMLFWCGALYCFMRIDEAPASWIWWILFGLTCGLCIMSKVHGAFLWIGTGLYILAYRRQWLLRPQLYAAIAITAAIISPILFWNIQFDFITYRFHSDRVKVDRFALNYAGFSREIFGQFFYNNPVVVAVTFSAIAALLKKRLSLTGSYRILLLIALPMIAVLVAVSLFRNTFPHWSGPAYVTLLPVAGAWLARKEAAFYPKAVKYGFWLAGFVALLGLAMIHFYPGTLGRKDAGRMGKGDFTLDMNGWREAGDAFASYKKAAEEKGIMPAGAPMAGHKWFPAAHLDYYFCRPAGIKLIGLGSLIDLHHYYWLNAYRMKGADMQSAWLVVPSTEPFSAKEAMKGYYTNIDSLHTITATRSGRPSRTFTFYKLTGWKGKPIPVP